MRLLLVAGAATLALDAVTKLVASTALAEGRLYAVAPGWGLRRVTNRRSPLSPALATVLLAALVVTAVLAQPQSLAAAGLGIALGGAAGNFADRVRHGAVVDFVAAGSWPVFNLADAAMTVGLVVAAVGVL